MSQTNIKRIRLDIILMIVTSITPFAFYIYLFAPEQVQVWETAFFRIDAGFIEDVGYYLWAISVKSLTIILLSVWFITCSQRWFFILIPLITYEISKILAYYNFAQYGKDEIDLLKSIIIAVPFIYLLHLISLRYGYRTKHTVTSELNGDINELILKLNKFNLNDYKEVKKSIVELRENKTQMNKRDYLERLVVLQDQLTMD